MTIDEIQRIKDSVLAEVAQLCEVDDVVEVLQGLWVKSYEKSVFRIAWFDCYVIDVDGDERRVFKVNSQLPADDPYWQVAYAILRHAALAI